MQIDSAQEGTTVNLIISEKDWVRETRFGRWFLTTNVWYQYVLTEAVLDLKRLLGDRGSETGIILDAGCGSGLAFSLLESHFKPKSIIGVDIDKAQLSLAAEAAKSCSCEVDIKHASVHKLNIPDNSIDIIFSHQLLHHVSAQSETLREFYRILAPGGAVLISESCRVFINSWSVRFLFRHPMMSQKSAQEFVKLVRLNGFSVNSIETSRPWWSHEDFGLTAKLGLWQKSKEVTEVLMIAKKPYPNLVP